MIFVSCVEKQPVSVAVKASTNKLEKDRGFGFLDLLVEILSYSSYKIVDYSIQLDEKTMELIDTLKNPEVLDRYMFKGKSSVISNRIYLDRIVFNINNIELQNGYMNLYLNDTFRGRLLLLKSDYYVANNYDRSKFPDYALFNAPKDSIFDKKYNLNQENLEVVDSILKVANLERKETKLNLTNYFKQLKTYANADSIVVQIDLFPKDLGEIYSKRYEFSPIILYEYSNYEGPYGSIRLNLTKRTYTTLEFFENAS
ncbi:hypothetical protein [Sphingobacterium sp. UDSM-2020]|uniref:hypothetical protein n=1 Tax=Sphingobacterium sp. UDSM-2020 TaxID=2795738 RepID=UPI001938A1FF|nr:hypothetical protein [Sphingobacterium sp. UDSM-2020]QQD12723.1 hypothetical protein JAZ75_19275 [Sphingobacterium sp. UDSM-2020]